MASFYFTQDQQFQDWMKLNKAIDQADTDVPCTNWPDAFFANRQDDYDAVQLAKSACAVCPVTADCLAYAMKWEDYGTWGGYTALERRQLKQGLIPLSPKRVA